MCYARFPKYIKLFEVEKGTQIPIVNASDMEIYRNLLKTILKVEKE